MQTGTSYAILFLQHLDLKTGEEDPSNMKIGQGATL